jgi:radical SAM protein with 4Fe4S-binding SPASM domain
VIGRKLKKALKRIRYIPQGPNLWAYMANKISACIRKINKNTSLSYPSTIMVELTNACNLHCTTCPREYQYGQEMHIGFMDFDVFKSIVDQASPFIDSIGLTGLGEPLLYKHLPQALAYIKQKNKGIITSVSTNANLPTTPEIISNLKEHLDTLQISIDGIGETYHKIRKNSNFEQFRKHIEEIVLITKYSDTDLLFNMVVTNENYHDMGNVMNLAHELGVPFVTYTLFNLASVTNIPVTYYDFYHSPAFKNSMKEMEKSAKEFPSVSHSFWDFKTKSGFRKCPFPWTHFYYSWEGYLVPCCAKPFPKLLHFGNIKENSLMECINHPKFIAMREMWKKNNTPDFCRKCHFIDLKEFSL